MQWPMAYMDHDLVKQAQRSGGAWPLPLAIYMDGVRFTAPLAGRSDSILGFWAYNGVTQKRHYLMSLRSKDMCGCGCKGWCSIYPVMVSFAWSLRALAAGRRPPRRHDDSPWSIIDPLRQLEIQRGATIPTAVLVWLKGDWSEVHHTLALPSVSVFHCPCPFCACGQATLHADYILSCFLFVIDRTQRLVESVKFQSCSSLKRIGISWSTVAHIGKASTAGVGRSSQRSRSVESH